LKDERVKVIAHFREEGAVLAGTQRGFCEDFDIELSLNGNLAKEEIVKLIRLAHRMCFTESALTGAPRITARHVFNGEEIEMKE